MIILLFYSLNCGFSFDYTWFFSFLEIFSDIYDFQAPNWSRLNEILNKLRFGPDSVFAKAQKVEKIADKETERAKAILDKKRKEIISKAAEMEKKQNGRLKEKDGKDFLKILMNSKMFFFIVYVFKPLCFSHRYSKRAI